MSETEATQTKLPECDPVIILNYYIQFGCSGKQIQDQIIRKATSYAAPGYFLQQPCKDGHGSAPVPCRLLILLCQKAVIG
ncbi:Rab GTPase binding, partial [Desmophyllum pertusum]